MNKNYLWMVAALAVMTVCMSGAMAFTQDVMIKSTNGGVAPTFAMSIAVGDVTFPLSVGVNEKTDGPALDVSSNTAYTVSAVSSISNQPAPSICHMAGTDGTTWSGGYLTSPFEVGVNGDSYQTMIKTGLVPTTVTLRSGNPEVLTSNLKFRQSVSVLDPVLPANSYYKIGILISGSATP